MNSRDYFRQVQDSVLSVPHVIQSNLSFDEISESECYIRGLLLLSGGFELYVAEYVVTDPEINRLKYRYHLQSDKKEFVARWDNAPHHPEIVTHPHHLHLVKNVVKSSTEMNIEKVLNEAFPYLTI